MRARVEAAAVSHGLEVSAEGWRRLEALSRLWLHYGRALNLTGARDESACAHQVLEGLYVARCAELALGGLVPGVSWLDIGSGGGFPALVVLAVWPDLVMTLVEPREKRRAFLEMATRAIGRTTSLVSARWEGSTWNKSGVEDANERLSRPFSVLSARAVWEPEVWLDHAGRIAPGSTVILNLREGASLRGVTPVASVGGDGWLVQAVRV